MDVKLRDQLAAHLVAHQRQRFGGDSDVEATSTSHAHVSYGTAGFRGDANKIEHLFFKVGLVAGLKSLQVGGKNIGLMITASHNPIEDNGVKLINARGEMLESEWEPVVERLCNSQNNEEILEQLNDLYKTHQIPTSAKGQVLLGFDTRPSSEALVTLVKKGIDAFAPQVQYKDYGLLTTPALHYLVGQSNLDVAGDSLPPPLSIDDYYSRLKSSFMDLCDFYKDSGDCYARETLVVDCANGVGYETMRQLCCDKTFMSCLPVALINVGADGILNRLCGADFVKTKKQPPTGANSPGKRYASLDGDADRVVYFYLESASSGDDRCNLKLLDGDKIMALFANYLQTTLKKYNLSDKLTLGLVQTAYANGASTDYMSRELGIKVEFADTGVKHLHRKAAEFDLGVYFEANGHGTIWISPKARRMVEEDASLAELKKLFAIVNTYTGDAISDILVVETILKSLDWDARKWDQLYQDSPNSLIKVAVRDRNCVKTTNAARTCLEPPGLQAKIDELVANFGPKARSFVRASGTEDVVRIYAEADSQESADELARLVGEATKLSCEI